MADTLTRAPERPEPEPAPASPWRPGTVLAVVAVLLAALFGGNFLGVRDDLLGAPTAAPRAVAAGRTVGGATDTTLAATGGASKTVLRSEPWWQGVTTLQGTGSTTATSFTIYAGAIQWRATWQCQTGHLRVSVPNRPRPIVDGACPGTDVGYGIDKGNVTLNVVADGPWQLKIDQQIDVPLDEPPLPAMSAPGTTVVSRGDFYRIDQVGQGTATLYRLADGTYALRFENFFVTPNSELEIRFSALDAPKTTDQFVNAPQATVTALDVTAGSLNFTVPPAVNPRQFHSIVLWCEQLHSAYAAVSLP